ncbi:hypothetical protein [Anaeromyxobacter diazotrophicus]|nr:hypothetical protein [Anaeromyxobacter diazotrophicus]
MPPHRERAGWAVGLSLGLLLAAAGCGTKSAPGGQGRPTPSAVGQPTGHRRSLVIDATGGTVASTDGVLTLTVPAGALTGPVNVTVDAITNTAPGGVGTAYRLGPAGTTFASPLTLVFKPDLTAHALADLVLETQESQGYWIRPGNVTRDATAGTLTVAATGFGDWAVATGSTARDLVGNFSVQSTVDGTYAVSGQSTLNFAGEDPVGAYYLQSGTLTLTSVSVPGLTCTPDAPTLPLLTNIADLLPNPNPTKFEWGVSGHWNLTCTSSGGAGSSATQLFAFDTSGESGGSTLGCTRTYSGTPIFSGTLVQGTMLVDCGARGTLLASWNFQSCLAGTACTPANACHTGAISCSTGAPVCADSGTSLADGTACGTGQVCLAGACNACAANVTCAPADPCLTGTTSCSTGTSVCVASGNQPDGTSCGTNLVCSAGSCVACSANLACAPATNLCHVGTTSCSTGASTCTDTGASQPDGTSCGTAMACTAGACTCAPGGTCTAPADLCHVASYTCDLSGNPVCTPGATPVADGTVCGTGLFCSAGACISCSGQPDGTTCGAGLTCVAGVCK